MGWGNAVGDTLVHSHLYDTSHLSDPISRSSAVKLLTALIGVALNLSVSVDNSQRLYEVEKAKASSKRVGARLEKLQHKIDEVTVAKHGQPCASPGISALIYTPHSICDSLADNTLSRLKLKSTWAIRHRTHVLVSVLQLQDKRLEMENMMDVIFKGVFLKRYR